MSKIKLTTLDGITHNDAAATLAINNNFKKLSEAIDNSVSRDGSTPNFMDADLDLNNNHIINLAEPTSDTQAISLGYFKREVGSAKQDVIDAKAAAERATSSAQTAQVAASNALASYNATAAIAAQVPAAVASGVQQIQEEVAEGISQVDAELAKIEGAGDRGIAKIDGAADAGVVRLNEHTTTKINEIDTATEESIGKIRPHVVRAETAAANAVRDAQTASTSATSAYNDMQRAETAALGAISASSQAVSASQSATNAANRAEAARDNAENSANSADNAAQSATSSESSAATSASDSLGYKNAAEQSAGLAESHALTAETYSNQAEVYKNRCEEILQQIGTVIRIKGRVDSVEDLPQTGNIDGDAYLVGPADASSFAEYFWIQNHWEYMGSTTAEVDSVNGKKGVVVLTGEDISADVDAEPNTIQGHLQALSDKIKDVELFKFPNAVIEGSPTLSSGQVSDFSNADYLQFPFLVDLTNRRFQIDFCFTTGADVTTQQNILDSEYGLALAIKNGKGLMAISHNGTSWAGQSIGTITIAARTTYYARLSWNGLLYKTELSTDGTVYTSDMTFASTQSPYPRTMFIGGSPDLFGTGSAHPFSGSINLNYAFLTIEGQLIWQGMDDAGLATRADISLSNLDAEGQAKLTTIILRRW